MKHNALTDAKIRQAKPAEKSYTLFDGGGVIEVTPTGAKWWRLKYRIGGKTKRLFIGACDLISWASTMGAARRNPR